MHLSYCLLFFQFFHVFIYTNLKIFTPETNKIGSIKPLLFRCFILCSDFIKFHHRVDKLKSNMSKNSYLRDLPGTYIKEILDKKLRPKTIGTFKNSFIIVSYKIIRQFHIYMIDTSGSYPVILRKIFFT